MKEDDRILLLNTLTGRVHEYNGVFPGGIGGDNAGVIPCDCDGKDRQMFKEAMDSDSVTVITDRHLERGVWKPAPCIEDMNEGN